MRKFFQNIVRIIILCCYLIVIKGGYYEGMKNLIISGDKHSFNNKKPNRPTHKIQGYVEIKHIPTYSNSEISHHAELTEPYDAPRCEFIIVKQYVIDYEIATTFLLPSKPRSPPQA